MCIGYQSCLTVFANDEAVLSRLLEEQENRTPPELSLEGLALNADAGF